MALSKIRNDSLADTAVHGRRNLIINGAMQVAQRGTSATNAGSGGVYLIDRFEGFASGGGVYTMEQSTTVPNNTFKNSVKLAVTTADSSIASGDYYAYNHSIEGNNIINTGYGTSDAKYLTLSFWVRSSVTGTYSVTCYNSDGSRGYLNTFSISSADTWTKVSLSWEGDTGGTWNKNNTKGITIRFDLGSGSSGHGTANQWTTSGTFAANRTSGSADWIATNGATFYLTGVQLEVGEQATPFEHRSYGEELALCQRYFVDISGGQYHRIGMGYADTTSRTIGTMQLAVPLRGAPSLSHSNLTNNGTAVTSISNANAAPTTGHGFIIQFVLNGGSFTVGDAVQWYWSGSSGNYFRIDSEL